MSKRHRPSNEDEDTDAESAGSGSTLHVKITPFVNSLWNMLSNPAYEKFISWKQNGCSFNVHHPQQFEQIVLPKYFKHRKFTSFIRQLNMYNFKRLTTDSGSWEWRHECFRRGHREMLGAIRRRSPESGMARNTSTVQPIDNGCAFSGNESLDHRVHELEKSREVLVKELQVGRRIQRDMQKEIEALKSQMNGVLSVLLRQISQTQGPPSDSIFRNVSPMLLKGGQSDNSVHTTPAESLIDEADYLNNVSDSTMLDDVKDWNLPSLPSQLPDSPAILMSDGAISSNLELHPTKPESEELFPVVIPSPDLRSSSLAPPSVGDLQMQIPTLQISDPFDPGAGEVTSDQLI